MNEMDRSELLEIAKKAAIAAGEVIMKVYESGFEVESKSDDSPVTVADKKADELICEMLKTSAIPVLSEEGNIPDYDDRKSWDILWIVDPLDGTREFVNRNGQFTVNIALVESGLPVLGVIYVPVSGVMYFGAADVGSYKLDRGVSTKLPMKIERDKYVVVGSKSHLTEETKAYFDGLKSEKPIEILQIGSSLKICMVAEGTADEYPRFGPTMEWDTAAGHAIAKYAGKQFIDLVTGKEMEYNRQELKNGAFIVS